jgi:hypothetical protein
MPGPFVVARIAAPTHAHPVIVLPSLSSGPLAPDVKAVSSRRRTGSPWWWPECRAVRRGPSGSALRALPDATRGFAALLRRRQIRRCDRRQPRCGRRRRRPHRHQQGGSGCRSAAPGPLTATAAEQWDLGDLESIQRHVAAIKEQLGPNDILVNVTGGPPPTWARAGPRRLSAVL